MKLRLWSTVLLVILFSFLGEKTQATHIVGGELTLTYQTGDTYRLRMTLYFDAVNGSSSALDPRVQIRFFRKRDNLFMRNEILPLVQQTNVNYTNPACALTPDGVQTDQIVYEDLIELPMGDFADSSGFYATWDRCCRNNIIGNIVTPGATGQLFYLEFPGRRNNGLPFVNSSPTLFRPLSDFACRDQAFAFNFSGNDVDGDSLAYALAMPLAGNSASGNVGQYPQDTIEIFPQPYPEVTWLPGFSVDTQVVGAPPIGIDPITGVLSMIPTRTGLFVFAIECREYRQGRQIGIVRRDYQILVKDCAPNTPPHLTVNSPTGFSIAQGDTVTLDFQAGAACLPITIADTLPDEVHISLIAPELEQFGTFRDTVGTTASGRPSFGTTYCINACAAFGGAILEKVIVRVRDNACSIPATDTLMFYVRVNSRPVPPIDLYFLDLEDSIYTVRPGNTLIGLQLTDSMAGVQTVSAQVTPPLPPGASLTVTPARAGPPTLFNFDANLRMPCSVDTNARYTARFIARSTFCGFSRQDTIRVVLRLRRPAIAPHLLVTTQQGLEVTDGQAFSMRPGRPLALNLTGRSDFDSAAVSLTTRYTVPLNAEFTAMQGPSPQQAMWAWTPTCQDLGQDVQLWARFAATIRDCGRVRSDSISIRLDLSDTAGGEALLGNVVTPDNDEQNDLLTWRRPTPVENCQGGFENLKIYNRWGRAVFATTRFDFVWPPPGIAPGMYFVVYRFAGRKKVQWVEVVKD